ncbi:4'-phosphopantetheinyl transferase [Macrolepiota fuliginosa MF-IS2]|uniref:holo-[acyl-carrier-protein] synthase n=1 Tax=Macrolepiota fuliginosa MF-IS2 TaxID=1400762 RepID=A0A9P6C616_9AGAR|nr:4'-phosphopantetheinyl transferase [Macrolepiota fuliginosa MF-IS2]
MQVWAVFYHPTLFTEDLYQRALGVIDVLDPEASARIRRFYRREDACRTLIGHLLRRLMLLEKGVDPGAMKFAITEAGKPYIVSPNLDPPLGFNITHDNALVAMAFSSRTQNPPAFSVGIDVMRLHIPGKESFPSFVHTMGDQLTAREHCLIFSAASSGENLQRFFWIWTMKEAYTKALGVGLGFDFKRLEFDVEDRILRADGEVPVGWHFRMFVLRDEEDVYEGVVAEFLGDGRTDIVCQNEPGEWLKQYDAVSFVEQAILRLSAH